MIAIDIRKKLYGSDGEMEMAVKLDIKEVDFVALSGKSGSGKTTLLRILAGLEVAEGTIMIGERCWQDARYFLSPQKREIGFVFQEYALFDNMSVEENLLFVRKDKQLAKHLLEMTELGALKKRRPAQLSGGQKQRISLCRALMNRPKLLLMDEPLSALDARMRGKLQQEILTLHREFGTTTIMVSHDPSEMYKMSQRVIMIEQGKIINDGPAKEILLKQSGSQKFSFRGEILDIVKMDVIYVAIVAIGQQVVEVVLSQEESRGLQIGEVVDVSTKAFSPHITQGHL